jgi:hypothetical protein
MVMELSHRLNGFDRNIILNTFTDYTFQSDYDILTALEQDLALRVRSESLDRNISIGGKIYREIDLIEMLPKDYSSESYHISVNAGGYSVYLYFGGRTKQGYLKTPLAVKILRGSNNRYNIQNQKLISEVQSLEQRWKTLDETKKHLQNKMLGFLKTVTTVKAMFANMPELKDILGDKWLPEKPSNALVITASEILCEVAKIRGEDREGCCNGVVI